MVNATIRIVVAAVGFLCTMSVMLTYWMFQSLQAKQYMIVVFNITICLFIIHVSAILGPSEDGSAECWIQGIIYRIFTQSAVFWCAIITYMFYSLAVTSKSLKVNWKHRLFSWGTPVILAVVPLVNATYGMSEDGLICTVVESPSTPAWSISLWHYLYDIPLFLCLGLMVTLLLRVAVLMYFSTDGVVRACMGKLLIKLSFSPIIILICWAMPIYLGYIGVCLTYCTNLPLC